MSALIDVQQENDIVWTMRHGQLIAWQVQDAMLVPVDPVEAMRDTHTRLERQS